MRLVLLLASLALAGCGTLTGGGVSKSGSDPGQLEAAGPMLRFEPAPALPVTRGNAALARDFMDLEFRMESGVALTRLTRFEAPVRVAVEGAAPPTTAAETAALMARLRDEAGIDIGWADAGAPANLVLSFLPSGALRRMEPSAACFVVPNVAGRAEWRARRRAAEVDWTRLTARRAATLFLPDDAAPQELRDCLHEEMAQALGPVNDLYRLPDSVFNDDNFQSVLTGFDMLMLRVHYAPELANGMAADQVVAVLPAVLDRLNPKGAGQPAADPGPTPRLWIDGVAEAMAAHAPKAARLKAAERVLALAAEAGWQDNRAGFSWFLRGRLLAGEDPVAAHAAYQRAAAIYADLPDGGIHLAHALMQIAALDLSAGDLGAAEASVARGLPLARRAQNAALIATFDLIAAEVAERQGAHARAETLRLDSLPAARYGFGHGAKIRARAAEIAAIARLGPEIAPKG